MPTKEDLFQRVRLETGDGGFVVRGWIPRFVTGPPRILLWGERFFHRLDSPIDYIDPALNPSGDVVYREEFTIVLVDVEEPQEVV